MESKLKPMIEQARCLLEGTVSGKLEGSALKMSGPALQRLGSAAFKKLSDEIGAEKADAMLATKKLRDPGGFHITVLSPVEVKKIVNGMVEKLRAKDPSLSKTKAESLARKELDSAAGDITAPEDWRVKGIGRAVEGEKEAYFVVVDWPGGGKLRQELGFSPEKDFHLTLGFKVGDVHGVPKDGRTVVIKL